MVFVRDSFLFSDEKDRIFLRQHLEDGSLSFGAKCLVFTEKIHGNTHIHGILDAQSTSEHIAIDVAQGIFVGQS